MLSIKLVKLKDLETKKDLENVMKNPFAQTDEIIGYNLNGLLS